MSSNIGVFSRNIAPRNHTKDSDPNMEQSFNIITNSWPSTPPNYDGGHSPRTPPRARVDDNGIMAAGLDYANVFIGMVVTHPCVVMRRQCQLHFRADTLHLLPFTLLQPVWHVHNTQGTIVLWKGVFGSLIHAASVRAVERALADLNRWPLRVHQHSSARHIGQHFALKVIAIAVTTPIAIQVLIETVQSACASETPALFDCIKLGVERVWMDLTSLASSTPSRQTVPFWHLLLPTITHRLAHYLIAGAVHYGVRKVVRRHLQAKAAEFRHRPHSTFDEFYPDLFATFASQLAADAVLYPFETVLHRLFVQGTRTIIDNMDTGTTVIPVSTRYTGVVHCLTSIISDEGALALFAGVGSLALQYAVHWSLLQTARKLCDALEQSAPRQRPAAMPRQPLENAGFADDPLIHSPPLRY